MIRWHAYFPLTVPVRAVEPSFELVLLRGFMRHTTRMIGEGGAAANWAHADPAKRNPGRYPWDYSLLHVEV